MKDVPEAMSLTGAISLYEAEGQLITQLLTQQDDRHLYDAWDAIGSALYWAKDQVETFMIPAAVRE